MKYSPVILFTYNRPEHTEQVLYALKGNLLASESDLTIFVDGLKKDCSEEDRITRKKLLEVLRKEQWCKTVDICISDFNKGCRNSIIEGISATLEINESVIVLEDDILTSPYFLSYMNAALDYYKNRFSVFSISGHSLPENKFTIPEDYDYDVFVSLRLLNWGWGTWKNRWEQVVWDKKFIPTVIKNKFQIEAFDRGGDDLSRMLVEEYENKSDAWDIQFAWAHFMNHAISIVPCHSYVKNIGLDGTGTHVKEGTIIENDLSYAVKTPRFLDVLYEDKRIINAFYNSFCAKKRPLWKKMINRISRLCGLENVFTIKKKIYY